jgi:Ni/Fe-hydrogenase subunit HybB-like protein
VLFLVAWHFLLYMIAEFIEFSPAVAEWLGLKRVHKVLASLTLGAVVIGITLSTLHQSGLGALFMMAKSKIHPLWYSEFIPVVFFVSSIFAGLSMVIFEGSISQRVFRSQTSAGHHASHNSILLGLAKICGYTMFVYMFLKVLELVHGQDWRYLGTGMGLWYLTEMIGFVLVPCILFMRTIRTKNLRMVKTAAILALIGIILNRLNVSIIGFKWYEAVRYVPTWMEIVITLAVVSSEIWVFRWVVNRMPVLRESPDWAKDNNDVASATRKEKVAWKASTM